MKKRFAARKPWNQMEMYDMLDLAGIPHEQIYEYFPPKGITVAKKEPRRFKLVSL